MTSILTNTKDYFELVKAIGEAKSKQEEDRIITEEVRSFNSNYCGDWELIHYLTNIGGVSQKSCGSNWNNQKEAKGVGCSFYLC